MFMKYALLIVSLSCMATTITEREWAPLKEAVSQSMPGVTLEDCVGQYLHKGWECTDALAIAAADFSEERAQDLLKTDRVRYDFLRHCQGCFIDRANKALTVFEPVADFILRYQSPVCGAVLAVYRKVQLLNEHQKSSKAPWRRIPKIHALSDLVSGLRKLEVTYLEGDRESFAFPGMVRGCNMEDIWVEFLLEGSNASLAAYLRDLAEVVSLLERRNVDPGKLANFCLEYATSVSLAGDRNFFAGISFFPGRKVDKESTVYKFFYAQNIENFTCLLRKGESHLSEGWLRRLDWYFSYLSWKSHVNWWDYIAGLLRSGVEYAGNAGHLFEMAQERLMREGGDLDKAFEYIQKVEKLSVAQHIQDKALQDLIEWLHCDCEEASAIWHKGCRVRNVDMLKLNQMISHIDEVSERRSHEFFSVLVQSLPPQSVLRCGGNKRLEGGLYKQAIEGENALQLMSEMLSAGKASVNPGLADRPARNARVYLKYLSSNLTVADLFEMLRQVPYALKENFLISSLVWSEIHAKGGCRADTLLPYLQFVIASVELDQGYVRREIAEVCAYLRDLGMEEEAQYFLQRSFASCSDRVQLKRVADVRNALQPFNEGVLSNCV